MYVLGHVLVEGREGKLAHVHQKHLKLAELSLVIVVIQVSVLELFWIIFVLVDKTTNAAQGCHSKSQNVLLKEEHVETSVNVMWRFSMDTVLPSITQLNVALNLLVDL